ncbi:flagellar biosynthetic protein FliO [Caproiciproducens sp. MSJ-32]|uniref:flagellar biosynthetic protein FliO n=1 Tax=Caproiciproducens sp. MSJ-32 TaxID=2841527 RepID=UPI001C1077AE|nr:flagellar biosynthetic protein FliO [Caproiciproducens sp. MSJ-32]MBU5454790.1 flagellar biosynthetic protein FliO [Caproiciproducens sp. MSJ-32]
MELAVLMIKLLSALVVVFALMFILVKISNRKLDKLNEGKYIRVLERTNISKDNSIILLKIGKKGYVISSSNKGIEKLEEISEEEIAEIYENKEKQKEEISQQYEDLIKKLNLKVKKLKNKNS